MYLNSELYDQEIIDVALILTICPLNVLLCFGVYFVGSNKSLLAGYVRGIIWIWHETEKAEAIQNPVVQFLLISE